jgi:IstB-like ATP binding protein
VRKSENGGSRRQRSDGGRQRRGHRRSPAVIQRDISQLDEWCHRDEGPARLELTMQGQVCPSRYVGSLLQSGDATFEFMGPGIEIALAPTDWGRSKLSKKGAEAILRVYGRRGEESITIKEFPRDNPTSPNFRAVLDQLNRWSALKAKLAFSFSLGPCTPVFVSEMQMDKLGRICFQGVCLDGNGSFLTVDIHKYDRMEVGVVAPTTDGERRALLAAKDYVESFADHLAAGRSLVFCGSPGTGKTHLACAIIKSLAESGRRTRYFTVRELIRSIRATWQEDAPESEETVLRRLRELDLLVLDEVGVQFCKDAELTQLTEVMDLRYRDMKPTLVVSNCTGDELKKYLGDRIVDRLRENGGKVAIFDWPSRRV